MDDNIPLNEGCLKPIEIIVPEGSLLNPRRGAAVVAGNVETSQIVVDALYGALGVLAASQGTMNNFTFGDDERQYYETICGGAGAGPALTAPSAVQTHMTNSRLTDPEVLETRFPGAGREIRGAPRLRRRGRAQGRRRRGAPHSLPRADDRGDPVQPPRDRAVRPCGRRRWRAGRQSHRARGWLGVQRSAATGKAEVAAGDVFVIETPGGGGYGKA